MNKILKNNFHVLLITSFAVVCYYFLWLSPYSMKWDMAEQYLPWRYFLGNTLQGGDIPYWNPFQLGGYPAYADPQSGFWYYPAWAIGMLFGYSMKTIEIEVLSFIVLAGIGFYFLLQKLNLKKSTACFFSISYLCSGFIVGNAQHLTWIAAAAWIPWLFYHYLSIRKDIYNIHTLWFLLILFLFVSSSYPAFVIVSAYIIILDQVYLFFNTKQKLKFIAQKTLLFFASVLILFPILYSLFISIDFFSRGDSLSITKVLQHPFSWQSLLSLLAPFASFKNPEFFKTDISMSNAYIGLFPMLIVLISLFSGTIKKNSMWLLSSILFLLIGFGAQTPLRGLLYEYLPGFNLFRFPALFRLFFIISMLIYTAKQFELIDLYSRKSKLIFLSFLSILIFTISININSWHPFQIQSLASLAKEFENTSFIQHIIYQFALHAILILIVLIIIFRKLPSTFILLIFCIDLLLSVRLNSMATMVLDTKTKNVDELISSAPMPYSIPDNHSLYQNIDQRYEYRWPLNWNMNCYFGQIAIDGYNPFVLKTFNALSDAKIKDSVWMNSWYFIPDSIIHSDTPSFIPSKTAWVNNRYRSNYHLFYKYSTKTIIEEVKFSTNSFQCNTISEGRTNLVFAQNPYNGWKAYIDGVETDIIITNYAQQLIHIHPGKHTVKWTFEDNTLKKILYIHITLFSLLLIFVTIKNISNLHL